MKRTQKTGDTKPVWRKTSPGKLYPFPKKRSHCVKQGDTVSATAEELGKFVKEFELVDKGTGEYEITVAPVETQKGETVENPDKEIYTIDSVGGGWFNVMSPDGKQMNDKKLRQAEAEALKKELEEETEEE